MKGSDLLFEIRHFFIWHLQHFKCYDCLHDSVLRLWFYPVTRRNVYTAVTRNQIFNLESRVQVCVDGVGNKPLKPRDYFVYQQVER
jgi:hypothetical protein